MGSGIKIGVVGPCAAGKTTLVSGMAQYNLQVRHIAQEHSYVPTMWQRITNPDLLIYLDVSYSKTMQRRALSWSKQEYQEQVHRLRHAREHAHLYIQTDDLTPAEVLKIVIDFITPRL